MLGLFKVFPAVGEDKTEAELRESIVFFILPFTLGDNRQTEEPFPSREKEVDDATCPSRNESPVSHVEGGRVEGKGEDEESGVGPLAEVSRLGLSEAGLHDIFGGSDRRRTRRERGSDPTSLLFSPEEADTVYAIA